MRQLDATVLSLKQRGQSSAAKVLEVENAALKQELEARRESSGGPGRERLESLQQENEALKTQMSRMSSQLIEVGTFPHHQEKKVLI